MSCAFCKKNNLENPFKVWESTLIIHDACFKQIEDRLISTINQIFPNTAWRNDALLKAINAIKGTKEENLINIGLQAITAYRSEISSKYKILLRAPSYH